MTIEKKALLNPYEERYGCEIEQKKIFSSTLCHVACKFFSQCVEIFRNFRPVLPELIRFPYSKYT